MNDEEEEIEVEAVPREPQEQRKPEAKTPARGRISARKMHKRRKSGQSIFQHNYGSKKGAKKKKKKTAKPQGIDHQTKKDEQFEINVQPRSYPFLSPSSFAVATQEILSCCFVVTVIFIYLFLCGLCACACMRVSACFHFLSEEHSQQHPPRFCKLLSHDFSASNMYSISASPRK